MKSRVFHVMTCINETVPVLTQYDSCQTRSKPVTTGRTCIHVNTHENTYWWSSTNYEPVFHVPTGSEMVPCLLGCVNETELLKDNGHWHYPFLIVLIYVYVYTW